MNINNLIFISMASMVMLPMAYAETAYEKMYKRGGEFNPVIAELKDKHNSNLALSDSNAISLHQTTEEITPESVQNNPELLDNKKNYFMSVVKKYFDGIGTKEMNVVIFENDSGENIKDYINYTMAHHPDLAIKEIHEIKTPASQEVNTVPNQSLQRMKDEKDPAPNEWRSRLKSRPQTTSSVTMSENTESELEKAFRLRRERQAKNASID